MKLDPKIHGIAEVNDLLSRIAPREAKNLMRATVHGLAGQVARDAKAAMPRDKGVLKKATKAKRRRGRPGLLRSDVIVERRAYYWRFLEYGTSKVREYAFFARAVEKLRANWEETWLRIFGRKLESRLARLRKKARG